jgi:cysteinyl-tRNA synthetase
VVLLAALGVVIVLAVWGVGVALRHDADRPDAARPDAPSVAPSPSRSPYLSPYLSPSAVPTRPPPAAGSPPASPPGRITSWAYQLQDYPGGRLDELARGPYQLAVVDLARDGHTDYFRPAEITALRGTGKRVLAYFEIGSIEEFRPEYPMLRRDASDLLANEWADWPGEFFVRYWDARWWQLVVQARVDQALRAGFDGVYLDTPLAYEQIDLAAAQGRDREALGQAMTDLIARISAYAKARHPGFLVVPQNSPELRNYPGYTQAIDGIAMEELFFLATDKPCTEDWCAENLADTRALRDAGKFVLSVDYATRAADVRSACERYRTERFAGTVTVLDLDRLTPPCA